MNRKEKAIGGVVNLEPNPIGTLLRLVWLEEGSQKLSLGILYGTYIGGYVRNCYKIETSFLDHPKQLASFMSTSCLNRFLDGTFLEPLGYPNLPATTAGL